VSTLADLRRHLAPWQLWLLDVGVPTGCALVATMFRDELESGWLLAGAIAIAVVLILRPRWSPARLVPRRWKARPSPDDKVGPLPRWLVNAAVALALVLATVQIAGGIPRGWWVLAAMMVAALLIQHRWPRLAVVLASTGAVADVLFGHLAMLPLDLAAPITVYTLASRASRRRAVVVAVAGLLAGVYLVSLVNEVTSPGSPSGSGTGGASHVCLPEEKTRPMPGCVGDTSDVYGMPPDKRAAIEQERRGQAAAAGEPPGPRAGPQPPRVPAGPQAPGVPGKPVKPVVPDRFAPIDGRPDTPLEQLRAIDATDIGALRNWLGTRLLNAFGMALFPMLVLGLALAFGDGVRSRRAHLRTLEQRAADLEREQHQRTALAAAAERARITRELHDVVAHGMSVMVVQAQGGAAALRRHPDRTAAALENVITTGRTSLAEMRRLLGVVSRDPTGDPQLAPQPGLASLSALVDQVRAAGTPVRLSIDGQPVPLPASVDLSAYRIVQEALTNTIKHAGPEASAGVRLAFAPEWVEVEICDDGYGDRVPGGDGRMAGGNGLRGIAERVNMLSGELAVGPGPGGRGFRVWALLPVPDGEVTG
jgi:signal transduction histidine kinase